MSSVCKQDVFIVEQDVLSVWTGCPQCVNRVSSVCGPGVFSVCAGCPQCEQGVLSVWSGCPQCVVWVSSVCGLGVLRVWSGCPQCVRWVSSGCGLSSYLRLNFVLFFIFSKNVSIQKLMWIFLRLQLKYICLIFENMYMQFTIFNFRYLICMTGAKHCIVRYLFTLGPQILTFLYTFFHIDQSFVEW